MDKPTSDNHSDATPRPGRVRVDWDAVRRDHRTGKYTDGELAELHGVSREAIVRRRKREPDAWPQDLSQAVREATNAALVTQMVTEAITDGHKQITDAVLVAAEINKQVILQHRNDLAATRQVAVNLLDELSQSSLLAEEQELLAAILAGSGAKPQDEAQARAVVQKALALTSRVNAAKALAETLTKLQTAERVAFKLDESDADDGVKGSRRSMTDAERAVRLANLLSKAGK